MPTSHSLPENMAIVPGTNQPPMLQWVFGGFVICAETLLDAWETYETACRACHDESFGSVMLEHGREAIWINLRSPALKRHTVN